MKKTSFKYLPKWDQDDHRSAFYAFEKSCGEIVKHNPAAMFGARPEMGTFSSWQKICNTVSKLKNPDQQTAKQFFETWFEPYQVKNNFRKHGIFTGYYLPLIHGSRKKTSKYTVPIYAMPDDLVQIDLGMFHADLAKKTIIAQLKNNKLAPYPDRAAINRGVLKAHVLLWADNPIDVFFAQIQGSAIVQLPNQQKQLIGYAGKNGQPYTPIGRVLVEKKLLNKKNVSMQTIRAWLTEHPDQSSEIINSNASYVFFRLLSTKDPLGTEQIPLTAKRSLAVDTQYIPLGAPIWVETTVLTQKEKKITPFRHLFIAQDTGGAIKGIVRADIYWGSGEEAAFIAGHMNNKGQYWILLPRYKLN